VVILFRDIWFLTSGINALSLVGIVGIFFFYFCIFFVEEKEGRDIP
jgi:hypothetical protein